MNLPPEDDELLDFTSPNLRRETPLPAQVTPLPLEPEVKTVTVEQETTQIRAGNKQQEVTKETATVVTANAAVRPPRRRPREVGPLGLPEAIALAAAFLLVIVAVLAYFLMLEPNRTEKAKLETQRTDARAELLRLQGKHVEGETAQQSVERIAGSVVNFERGSLARRETGRLILYRQLTELMLRAGVRNTAGPAYAELVPLKPEEAGRRGNTAGQKGSDKWQSIYPGLSVNMTVEGTYANVRRFVRDVEASGLFLIINAVEVEGSRNQDAANAEARAATNPNATLPPIVEESPNARRGSLVNLRLDLAAYFQRDTALAANGQ